MPRRIDVELTSARDDGSWTWRAAGAKQPKGVLDGAVLYPGAKVGDVVRAEADFEIDGINIVSVLPPKTEARKEPDRIEVIGTRRDAPGVTSSLVPKSDRPRRDRDRDRDGGRRERGGERPARGAGERGERRPPRDRAERPAGERPAGERPTRERREPREPRGDRVARAPRPERPPPPKPKRLSPANVHRGAVLESLPPEQRPIAEQVLRGGIPAVRQAVEQQNATLRERGEPEVKAEPLIAMAEELLPRLKAADWRDRAEAAVKDADEVSLRDLRSVVAGADLARDDESRELARTLRETLEKRIAKERESWVTEITTNLDEGRVVRALRLSARPPDPGSRFPAELALRLAEAAGAAMSPDISPDRWGTVLDAVASSPVRRTVKPAGLPPEPGEALLQAAKQASGRVPALAAMLGIDMPPPPGPPRGARPPRPPRPPVPPPPARPPAPPAPPAASESLNAEPAVGGPDVQSSEAGAASEAASEGQPATQEPATTEESAEG